MHWCSGDPAQHALLAALGPEPFDEDFDATYLADHARRRKVEVKLFLMVQHTVVGVGAMALSALVEGGSTNSHAAALYEARVLTRLAAAEGKSFGYGAIVFTHGESDMLNATYESELYAWWQDMNADLAAITGQTRTIPLFITQQSSVPWTTEYRV